MVVSVRYYRNYYWVGIEYSAYPKKSKQFLSFALRLLCCAQPQLSSLRFVMGMMCLLAYYYCNNALYSTVLTNCDTTRNRHT